MQIKEKLNIVVWDLQGAQQVYKKIIHVFSK